MAHSGNDRATRRGFLQEASCGAGLVACAGMGMASTAQSAPPTARADRLPREVWVATVSLEGLGADRFPQMIEAMLRRMEEILPCEPDIICLPEVFPFGTLRAGRPPLDDVAEVPIGDISRPFAEFARKHAVYVVCPIYTRQGPRFYNAAVFIDRKGQLLGEYRKMHLTEGEMEKGIVPGPLDPPVFQADFGTIGAQVCFDIKWDDGWARLAENGAEIVFWPSAFAGGAMVNAKAWQNGYCVVSSAWKDTSKICDVAGNPVAWTTRWNRWACAPINLEKAFLHTWPYCRRFQEIQAQYGPKIRITTYGEEEWSILESRSPDVKIADVLREFELKTNRQHIAAAEHAQRQCRPID